MNEKVKIGNATYERLADAHDTVFRIQEARSSKQCQLGTACILGGEIKPLMKYARVYFTDIDGVEFFHYSCFQQVTGHGRS